MVKRIRKSICQMFAPRLWMVERALDRVIFALGRWPLVDLLLDVPQ